MSKRAWWHGGRASDSESRGPGFEPHWWHRVVSLSNRARHTNFPEYWLMPRKRWLNYNVTDYNVTANLLPGH